MLRMIRSCRVWVCLVSRGVLLFVVGLLLFLFCKAGHASIEVLHARSDLSLLSALSLSQPIITIEWINDYHRMRPVHTTLQEKVDEYMDKFERSEYEAQQAAFARLNQMDDDGFTLVTRAGNKGHNTDGVIKVQAIKAEEIQNIKPKKKELQDFYRFQMREAKRDSTYFLLAFFSLSALDTTEWV